MRKTVIGLAVGAMIGGGIALAPLAQAGFDDCGTYQLPPESARVNPGTHVLVIQPGVTCEQARRVMDDEFAGKGTSVNGRNISMVDGYECVGSFGAEYTSSGRLVYCHGDNAWFAIQLATPRP